MENRKLLKIILVIFMAVIILVPLFAGLRGPQWILFYDKAINGAVLDAETGKPLEGVIIVAMWQLREFPGSGFGGYAKVSETTTDKDGRFKVPLWIAFKPWKYNSVVDELAPKVIIYKPGYKLFWTHKQAMEGYLDDYLMKKEERQAIIEANNINPAKLKRIYTDEEILKNYDEFSSQADFPGHHFSKKQSALIFDALDEELSKISDKTKFDTKQLIISNKKLREFWAGGN